MQQKYLVLYCIRCGQKHLFDPDINTQNYLCSCGIAVIVYSNFCRAAFANLLVTGQLEKELSFELI